MFHRYAILSAVAGLLASSGLAMADSLTIDPAVASADATASQGLLMQGLDKVGVGKTLADNKITVDGWVESGYTYSHRHGSGTPVVLPGPFNHEIGNHYMLNQTVLRLIKDVDVKKFDIGGQIEVLYGTDGGVLHPYGGLGFNGSDRSDNNTPNDPDGFNNLNPQYQFDIPQAYVTLNLPVGDKGLQLNIGKFAGLLGYESFEAVNRPFYSNSYLFNLEPLTHVGVLASYQVNDQLGVKLGVTRGWDMAFEDNNGCAIDVIGQVSYQFSKELSLAFNYSVGPENAGDTGHYRVALDPILRWQATDQLLLAVEGLYAFDGGWNGIPGATHAYGDAWGAALYAGYKINDMFTINGRVEKVHSNLPLSSYTDLGRLELTPPVALSAYEITLGTTITPMPKDQYLKGLSIRPEIRYDFTDSTGNKFFTGGTGNLYKDQLTFACDVIFAF
jgi:hypothetical protein